MRKSLSYARIPLWNRQMEIVAWVLVDADAHEYFDQWNWYLNSDGYAQRIENKEYIFIHREVLGLTRGDGKCSDHINRNRLDNRSANLRVVTRAQNTQNMTPWGKTGLRGVTYYEGRKKPYRAAVRLRRNGGNKWHYLGNFETKEEAVEVAKEFRRRYMEFANN